MTEKVPDTPHVLVVDDDVRIRDMLADYLEEEGMNVTAVGDASAARQAISDRAPDVLILDIRLPGEDGLSLAAELRRSSNLRMIMLSEKNEVVDRVAGLEVGADDYVSKPFHLRELLARVHSVLRRNVDPMPDNDASGKASGETFLFDGWRVDAASRDVRDPDGARVELSAGEFELLLTFLRNPKRALTREQILNQARDRAGTPFDRSIDVQVGRLRRKIETDPHRPRFLKTLHGVGYMFAVDVRRR